MNNEFMTFNYAITTSGYIADNIILSILQGSICQTIMDEMRSNNNSREKMLSVSNLSLQFSVLPNAEAQQSQ
jgi:hypothetical protein